MSSNNKAIFGIIGTVALVAMLPLAWVASNALSAVYYLVFTIQPTRQQLIGEYVATLNWGNAELTLHNDNTFDESLVAKGKKLRRVTELGKVNRMMLGMQHL